MKSIGEIRRENLEILLKDTGTVEALAAAAVASPVYLSQIRNQAVDSKTGRPREMGSGMARRLETAGKKPQGWMDADHSAGQLLEKEQPSNVTEITSRASVPLISWVAAGLLGDVRDNFHPGEADEWFDAWQTKPSKSAFALRVNGDSMTSPHPNDFTFPHGTIILVDPQSGADAGHFVVAKDVLTQKATFKKLTTDGGRWFLKPLNPTYPTVEIDNPALRVIGRVIESMTSQRL